jgi:DMSO/TMAO reductase YedYZ molybdopterin-dependent catalytic subunit
MPRAQPSSDEGGRPANLGRRYPQGRCTLVAVLVAILTAGCSRAPTVPACTPSPVVVPTVSSLVLGENDLDPETNLHYTGQAQEIDLTEYRLEVIGLVDRPLVLTYDDLRCLPRLEVACVLVCPGFFEDEARWAGARLRDVLDLAGVQDSASELRLFSQDRYSATVPLVAGWQEDSLLAYEWEGEPLPILHGFPVRAVFPDLAGNAWVKWLIKIQVR